MCAFIVRPWKRALPACHGQTQVESSEKSLCKTGRPSHCQKKLYGFLPDTVGCTAKRRLLRERAAGITANATSDVCHSENRCAFRGADRDGGGWHRRDRR